MHQLTGLFTKLSRRQRILIGSLIALIISFGMYLNFANALTATLLPTSTENNAWTAGTAGCNTATTGHTCVDEGSTGNDTDFVATGTGLGTGISTTFQIADQPNVGNATNLIVYYYARSVALNGNTPNADTITMNLEVGGVPVGSGSTQSMTTSFSWYSAQFSGNWTQAQVDDMKVRLTRTVVGGGNQANADDNVQISSVYVSMTYTSPVVISQVAYRWFGAEKTRPSGVYGTAALYGAGASPQGVVVDDFDNDQTLDIATANVGTDNISVLNGNGDGTFATKTDYAAGDGPKKIIATDLNNDQDKDLVVVNVNNASVSVLMGNGDGTFAAKVDYAAQTANDYIAAGDINNDGFIDIVTTGSVLNTYSVFMGNGDGTLDSAVNASGNGLRGVVVADVNNDQNQDLLFANVGTDSASVLLGNGDGTFAARVDYAAEDGNASIAIADFNKDQKIDIAIGSQSTTNISVLFGNGDGTFAAKVVYPAQNTVTSLVAADVNGDQYIDIVTFADTASTGMRVVRNNGDGTFATASHYSTSGSPAFGAIADVNEDGAPDAVAVTTSTNAVSVLLNGFNYPALSAVNTGAKAPVTANNFRLRINLGVTGAALTTGSQFKLRYQQKSGSCSTSPAAYADVTTATPIRYYDDPTFTDKSAYIPTDLDPTRSGVLLSYQTYNESNTFGSTSAVFEGRDGLWDLSLAVDPGASPGATYCLLATRSDGTALNSYGVIPEITIPNSTQEQSNYRFYQNANSTSPGDPLTVQNTKPTIPVGSTFRLRQLLRQTSETLDVGASFKLQAAEKITTCSAGGYATLSTAASNGTPASTGFKVPTLADSDADMTGYWSQPIETTADDGIGSFYYFNGSPASGSALKVSDYDFTVPSDATITGVELRYYTVVSTDVNEASLFLSKDGSSAVGTNMASVIGITGLTTYTKGSSTNLWGTTLTPAEVNSTTFGARFAVGAAEGSSTPDIEIDYMKMNIHYVVGETVASFTDNPTPIDEAAVSTIAGGPTASSGAIMPQNYSEDETATVRTALQTGENGLWDFSLRADESLIGKTYCFRVAKNDGTALASYAQYPEATFTAAGPTLDQQMRGGHSIVNGLKRPFNW